MKWNKKQLTLTSVLILLPIVAGLLLWNELPAHMVIHWGVDGNADGWGGRSFVVFGLPLIMLAIHWLCIWASTWDRSNKQQSSKVAGLILWIIPVTSFMVNGITYGAAFGWEIDMMWVIFCFLGLLFVAVGNYMPKCTRNLAIGIKVKWTLENEENWNATHRVGGRFWVVGGVLCFICAFLPERFAFPALVMVTLVAALAPLIYSYAYYRRQLRAGTWKSDTTVVGEKWNRFTKIGLVVTVVILGLVAVLLCTGDVTVHFEEGAFTLEADYWDDLSVAYDKIESIEYREDFRAGMRTFGFGSPRLSLGAFQNENFGSYTLYGYTGCEAAVVMTVGGETLVLTGRDAVETEGLYRELQARVQ